MDLFTYAALNPPKVEVKPEDALPLQPAQVICDCGAKSAIVHIPTLVIPQKLWHTYVEAKVGWKGSCMRCAPYKPGEKAREWNPVEHGLESWVGVRMSNDRP